MVAFPVAKLAREAAMPRPNKPRYRADRDAWVSKVDGVLCTLAKGKRNRAEAVKVLAGLVAARGKGPIPRSITVAELCDRLLIWVRDHRSPLTLEWYTRHLRAFVSQVGRQTPAESIRPYHVSEWLDTQAWGQSTRHGAITAVKRAFRWGKRQGYLAAELLADLDRPGIRRRESILSPDDERRVLDAARGPLRDYLVMMRETGCRPSEVARVEAMHVEGDTIAMPGKSTSRTGRPRVIYLTPAATSTVAKLVARHPVGPIFRNTRGNPWTRSALAHAMNRIGQRLGLGGECTAESLRHGWITDAKLKLPNSVVAELAGHTSTAMVDKHYGHIHERRVELAEAAAKVRGSRSDTVSPASAAVSAPPIAADNASPPQCEPPGRSGGA